ncbi:MAG: hypothetical protein AAF152_05535 [Cyanobacteria bacterium P01_A01_bin.114]
MTSTPTTSQPDAEILRPRRTGWLWPLLWLSLLMSSSALGIWALAWMTRIPPLPNCEQISTFSTDGERFYCAKVKAESGSEQDLIEAIALAQDWPQDHPTYKESQSLLNRWSEALLDKAQTRIQQGDLAKAIELVEHIPEKSEVYSAVEGAIATWQDEWAQGETIAKRAEQAIEKQDWPEALKALQELKLLSSDYWLANRHQALMERVQREKTSRTQLEEARAVARTGDFESIVEALEQVQKIDIRSQVWPEAKQSIDDWSDAVLQYSFRKWEQEDLDGAIEAIQKVPVDVAKSPEAQDLINFAYAKRLINQVDHHWLPSYGKLLSLREAIQAVRQIPKTSPFYAEAQASSSAWAQKLEDLRQLYFANMMAQLGHKPAYRLAIEQAQLVTPERPQRVQAQTLISHWNKEVERIEDRPYLARAEQFASADSLTGFQSAIAEAQQVELGRALRVEAQTKIAEWNKRIQIIEDQPIIDRAIALADQGKLQDAVDEIDQIGESRALHAQAKELAKGWITQIQIAADRPILVRAENLAARGRLSDAIAVAGQIGYGRALYGEARQSISIWAAERDAIWAAEAAAYEDSYDEYYEDDGYYEDDSYYEEDY